VSYQLPNFQPPFEALGVHAVASPRMPSFPLFYDYVEGRIGVRIPASIEVSHVDSNSAHEFRP
jgi:hypothetical protein